MYSNNVLRRILDNSRDCLQWILASNQTIDLDQFVSLAHQICYTCHITTFPYFANRDLRYESRFAKFWICRLERRGLVKSTPLQLTRRGKLLTPTGPLKSVPKLSIPETILPYSSIPPGTINFGSKTVKIRPEIGDLSLIMIALLPPDPTFFLIFSHFDKDGMRTSYPLLKENETFVSLFMGDIRNIVSIPDPSLLDRCYQNLRLYLGSYLKDFETHLRIVLYLLLSISRVRFVHLCCSKEKLLNKLTDEIEQMIDFNPTCYECGMDPKNHINLIDLRHSLGHAWEKGELSELFFAKLLTNLTSQIDPSIEVYPRLIVEGLPHECDVFVRKNDKILLFELKRSISYDKRCEEGVRQLNENKKILESWGMKCISILVTNMTYRKLPDEATVDKHLIPDDILDLGSTLESLV